MLGLLVVVALGVGADVENARRQLAAGHLDDVLFALDGKPIPEEDRGEAAEVLAQAAAAALKGKDAILCLQFAQMALKQRAEHPRALEFASRASLQQEQFGPAEAYADQWILAEPKNGSARLLRAELAVEAGEWALAVDQLDQASLKGVEAERAKTLRANAQHELKDRKLALTTVASLERKLMEAAAQAKKSGATRPSPSSGRGSGGITLYSTSWCGYCKQAKQFLERKGVPFTERDVEKDEGAADELARKAAAAGVHPRGVPVIDVRGKLLLGFSERSLEAAL